MNTKYKNMAKKLKAISHPVRLEIVDGLLKDECCVGKIQKCLKISQPNVSQHLMVLKEAGIIKGRRDGNRICYKVIDSIVKGIIKNVKFSN